MDREDNRGGDSQRSALDLIEKIVDFVIHYSSYTDRERIKRIIQNHIASNTCECVIDKGKVVAVVRWNISRSGRVAEIFDLIIHPDYRNKNIWHYFIQRGISKFPSLEYFMYWRGYGEDIKTTPPKVFKVDSFIRHLRRIQ